MNNFFRQLKFGLYAIKMNLINSSELRQSFLLNIVGMALSNFAFLIMWVGFSMAVGKINGWNVYDVVGMQGLGSLSYGLLDSLGSGMNMIPEYISSGALDRYLLSPKNLLWRISTSRFNDSGIGDIVFGLLCIAIYCFLERPDTTQWLILALMILVSLSIFVSVTLVATTIGFFFTDASSLSKVVMEIFITPTLFHGGAFRGILRFFYIFVIPSLLIGALPIEVIRDVSWEKLIFVLIMAIIWPILAVRFFYYGVRRYESGGFMTFGS